MVESIDQGEAAVASARRWRRLLAFVAVSVWMTLGGCVSKSVVDSVARKDCPTAAQQRGVLQWHYARFRLQRDDDNGVNSYLDLMLADQVLAPVINRYFADIPLWRFHRRWPEDATGHQFSYIFSAPVDTAARIKNEIEANPLLETLGAQGYLVEYRVDEGKAEDPAATSDPAWPESIRREWPTFIMGASRMWLGLVQNEAALHDSSDLHTRYRTTEEAIDGLWFSEGNHAFFHHLSALFGYKPLRVIRRDVMTF